MDGFIRELEQLREARLTQAMYYKQRGLNAIAERYEHDAFFYGKVIKLARHIGERPMVIVKPTDGFRALADAVIRSAANDLMRKEDSGTASHYRYLGSRFFLSEYNFDLYTGLAPHMIRDWEKLIPLAREVYENKGELKNGTY